MILSQNLALAEYTASAKAAKLKIDNTLPPFLLPNAAAYANKCFEEIRRILGNRPRPLNSGYRCHELNSVMPGASPTSQHMAANAADYAINPGENIYVLFIKLLESDLNYDQLLIEGMDAKDPRKGWLHVSYNTLNVRGVVGSGFNPKALQRKEVKIVEFESGKPIPFAVCLADAVKWAKRRLK